MFFIYQNIANQNNFLIKRFFHNIHSIIKRVYNLLTINDYYSHPSIMVLPLMQLKETSYVTAVIYIYYSTTNDKRLQIYNLLMALEVKKNKTRLKKSRKSQPRDQKHNTDERPRAGDY